MTKAPTAADLVAEWNKIDDYVKAETKRFGDHIKPATTRGEEIKNLLLAMLNEQRCDSFKTEAGTAYKSVIVTPSVTDKEKFLDFVLDDWDNRGDMLQIGAPKKEAVVAFQDSNNGSLPPYVETSSFTRVNIRKS